MNERTHHSQNNGKQPNHQITALGIVKITTKPNTEKTTQLMIKKDHAVEERHIACAKQMSNRDVDGFVIGGIQETGKQVRRIVEAVMWQLKGEERIVGLSG